jgi:hypothetical protein
MGANVVTPLMALQDFVTANKPSVQVEYSQGCYIMNSSTALMVDAVSLATTSDIAILFLGDNQARKILGKFLY